MIDSYHAREVPPSDERTWNPVRSRARYAQKDGAASSRDGRRKQQNERWVSPLGCAVNITLSPRNRGLFNASHSQARCKFPALHLAVPRKSCNLGRSGRFGRPCEGCHAASDCRSSDWRQEGNGGSSVTGDDGKARISLAKQTKEKSWVSLQILKSPPGKDFVMVSPWD